MNDGEGFWTLELLFSSLKLSSMATNLSVPSLAFFIAFAAVSQPHRFPLDLEMSLMLYNRHSYILLQA